METEVIVGLEAFVGVHLPYGVSFSRRAFRLEQIGRRTDVVDNTRSWRNLLCGEEAQLACCRVPSLTYAPDSDRVPGSIISCSVGRGGSSATYKSACVSGDRCMIRIRLCIAQSSRPVWRSFGTHRAAANDDTGGES